MIIIKENHLTKNMTIFKKYENHMNRNEYHKKSYEDNVNHHNL